MSESLQLNDIRERINTLKGEVQTLENAPISRTEAAEKIERWITDSAACFDADTIVESAATAGGIDESPFRLTSIPTPDGLGAEGSLAPVMCWLMGDTLKDKLLSRLDAIAPDACSTKDAAQRDKLLATKHKSLYQLEVDEEAEIDRLEAQGVTIARRRDCRPEIVLGMEAS